MLKETIGPGNRARLAATRPAERERGVALVATLLVVVLVAAICAAAVTAALSASRTASADYHSSRAFYAAEGGAESLLFQIETALRDGSISDAEIAGFSVPHLEGYEFTGFTVEKTDTPQVETITDGAYAGLYALTQSLRVTVPATDRVGHHATVVLGVKAQAIPIFQFGVFYELDLEIHPSPPMDFLGRVHTNGNLFVSSDNVWFYEKITTPNLVVWNYKPQNLRLNGVRIKNAAAQDVLLSFDSRDTPDPEQFKAKSNASFDDRLQSGAYGLDSLKLPMPEGVPPREIIRPRETSGPGTDGPIEQVSKFAWLADMYVTVDFNDIRTRGAVCGSPASGPYPNLVVERPFGGAVPADATKCQIFQFNFEQFFDSRDSVMVDVLDIDIAQLRNWVIASPATNSTGLIYVEFKPPVDPLPANADTLHNGAQPRVRIKSGSLLPGPLTIATEYPVYVWGNYNLPPNKKPAAIVGDAYTVLSNAWSDATHKGPVLSNGGTTPSATSVYAAIMAGHQESDCDVVEDVGCAGQNFYVIYGGGFENYPRFLENWSGVQYTYRGSIVSLWLAQIALGEWVYGTYYKPPVRNWGFDLALLDPDSLPPGTPVVGSVLRTSFREGGY
jgi:hypothetical protein